MIPFTPKIPDNALRIGYYSDKYFLRTQEILMKDDYNHKVHYQYFPRKNCVVCGIHQVLQIFESCIGFYANRPKAWELFSKLQKIDVFNCDFNEIREFYQLNDELNCMWTSARHLVEIYAINEGSEVKNMQPVIGLIGNPKYFAHLETATLGVLAQQSAVATSVRRVVDKLLDWQTMLFFPARFRHYNSQAPDGYAATIGGISAVSTDANGEYWGYDGIGTIPHLLIAAYGGNTSLAALKFDEIIDPKIDRVILVDWDNDVIKTSLEVIIAMIKKQNKSLTGDGLREYCEILRNDPIHLIIQRCRDNSHMFSNVIGKGKGKLFGVRFDTSGALVDKSLYPYSYKGVTPELVKKARQVFDEIGLQDLKIIVSGGFDSEKIERFQELQTPVDSFGIGSSIVNKFHVDFTADAVTLDGEHNAKVGRKLMEWEKMNLVI
jgi:nicotinate phosphoribosyltransferase